MSEPSENTTPDHAREAPLSPSTAPDRSLTHAPTRSTHSSTHAPAWWTKAVVYQIYPRSFADSSGDGIGDLRGIAGRLDYLRELGVDVLWLSPVYRSPQADNGYDISDYEDIDPMFGTMADMEALISGAHERGMRIVMDLVVNHTSDQHPWFVEASSSLDNPKRDWYWWRSPREGHTPGEPGAEPTNWGSAFSGPAWTYDQRTGEYYLHLFAPAQPDLNWENPQVRQAVYAMMRRWLDRGVDGFRMDVINLISKAVDASRVDAKGRPALPDGPMGGERGDSPGVVDTAHYGDSAPFVINGPRVHEFLAEMHREVFADRPRADDGGSLLITVGETPACTIDHARLFTDPQRAELDMVFQFEHMDLDSGPGGKWDIVPVTWPVIKASLARWQTGLADIGWNSLYWDNHDQPRIVSRFGDDAPEHRVASAKTLATVLHLLRGTPYVYQGEELGMTNTALRNEADLRDIESINHLREAVAHGADAEEVMLAIRAKGRDNARTPMQWDASEHAGFTAGTPWIPANPNHTEINAAAQIGDPDSVFAHYRRLIALRHEDPTVQLGRFELLLPEHEQLFAYTRTLTKESWSGSGADGGAAAAAGGEPDVPEVLVVLANCSSSPLELTDAELHEMGLSMMTGETSNQTTGESSGPIVLGTHTAGGRLSESEAPRRLRAWESVVIRRQ